MTDHLSQLPAGDPPVEHRQGTFRDELALAIADAAFPVLRSHVGADGLPPECKRVAVEIALNFLVDMLRRLPEGDQQAAVAAISARLADYLED